MKFAFKSSQRESQPLEPETARPQGGRLLGAGLGHWPPQSSNRAGRRAPLYVCAVALWIAFGAAGAWAAPRETARAPASQNFGLSARAAIMIDAATGRVLYEHDADQPFLPASLTKLMSLHIVYEKLRDRTISRDDVVYLTRNAWANNQAPGSTLMHLGPGQIVTVEELMKGAAISSGNDAAVALAEYVAGSTDKFVQLMNEESRFMGYRVTHYEDPAGVGPDNRVTAREFADFCRRYIELHPEALGELHSLREFDYPLARNMPDGRLPPRGTRRTYNHNGLVWDNLGVDGLKTGRFDGENFTAAITAQRGETRLIVVLLGVPGRSLIEGARNRSDDGATLLTYGFNTYDTMELEPPRLGQIGVWRGVARKLAVVAGAPVRLTLSDSELSNLQGVLEVQGPIVAPISRGEKVGEIVYSALGGEVGRIPVVADEDVAGAGPIRQAMDWLVMGVSSLVGSPPRGERTVLDVGNSARLLSDRY